MRARRRSSSWPHTVVGGANLAAPRTFPPEDFLALLRQSDLYVILDNRTWQNAHGVLGFHGGEPAPEEALWIGANGAPDRSTLVCPEYITARGQRFLDTVLPELRRAFVEDTVFDAWATNWEPTVHYARGCFCPRCRTAFARFVGEPEAPLLSMPAEGILTTYKERWRQFRAGQSARLVKLALDIFAELGAERGRPIACLLWCGNAIFAAKAGEDGMREYLREAGMVASWSYAGWRVEEGRWIWSDPFYEETRREIDRELCHLLIAQTVEEITRRIPELTGRGDFRYLHAVMGHFFPDYVSTPEESTLDLLAAAIARPWAIRPPYFPDALDHRYAAGFAAAVRLIAAHEDIILDGRRVSVQVTPLSAYHRQPPDYGGLWARGFEHRSHRLYCLFNFARRQQAFFRLAIGDPPAGARAPLVLWDPVHRLHYSSGEGPALTEADLREGVTLHLGAARAAFLLLEPRREGADYGGHVDFRKVLAAFAEPG